MKLENSIRSLKPDWTRLLRSSAHLAFISPNRQVVFNVVRSLRLVCSVSAEYFEALTMSYWCRGFESSFRHGFMLSVLWFPRQLVRFLMATEIILSRTKKLLLVRRIRLRLKYFTPTETVSVKAEFFEWIPTFNSLAHSMLQTKYFVLYRSFVALSII